MNEHQIQKIISQSAPKDHVSAMEYTLSSPPEGFRPNVISIEDAFFGDSGKGAVTAKFNNILNQHKNLFLCGLMAGRTPDMKPMFMEN